MDNVSLWIGELDAAARRLLGRFVEFLPDLIGAVILLLVGWITARLLRAGSLRLAHLTNRLLDRLLDAESAERLRLSQPASVVVGNGVFWLVILVFVTLATRVLGLETFTQWLERIVAYLPTLIAGALIIVAGWLVSTLGRDLVATAVASAGVRQSALVGRFVQGAMMMVALVIGIDQIGIDVTFLMTLIAIVVATALGSLSLAFSFGARA